MHEVTALQVGRGKGSGGRGKGREGVGEEGKATKTVQLCVMTFESVRLCV